MEKSIGLKTVKQLYTDGQKKRLSNIIVACIALGSQTRAAQSYHYQNLESSLGVILICRLRLPGMLANIHACILTVFTIFPFSVIHHNF